MANGENVTIKFRADVADLKSGITQANKDIKLANAEFKAAAAGMDDWTKSSDGIKAKLDQLGKTLTAEKTKLSAYKEQLDRIKETEQKNVKSAEELRVKYQQAAATYGENSAEAQKYKKQLAAVEKEIVSNQKSQEQLGITILNQQAKVAKAEKEFKGFEARLGQVEKAEKEAEKSGEDVADVLAKMDKAADDAGDGMKDLDGGFTIMKGTIADLASSGIQSLISGFQNLSENTRELRLEMGKAETAFISNGYSAETAQKTYEDFYAILGETDQSTEAISHLAKLTDSEEELAQWTNICTGVFGTFGKALPIENLTESANETVKVGKVVGALADAINWSTISSETWAASLGEGSEAHKAFQKGLAEGLPVEDAFNLALQTTNDESEREAMIRNALNGTYSEAAENYRATNGDIMATNRAQQELNSTMATLSEKMAPITTSIANGFAKILEKVLDLVGEENLEQWANDIAAAFDGFINTVLPAIETGLKWIIDNKDALIAGIVGIGAAFATFKVVSLIQGIVSALKGMSIAQAAVTAAQWLMNIAMNANPIGLIIAAIAGLVAAFLWLWNNCEGFRNFWIGLWESLLAFLQPVLDGIVKGFQDAWAWIVSVWDQVKPYFQAIWDAITLIFSVVVSWFSQQFQSAWNAIQSIWSVVVGFFGDIWNGITTIFSVVSSWFSQMFQSAWNSIQSIWSVAVGFFRGIWNGITTIFSVVSSWFSQMFQSAWNSIQNIWSVAVGFFRGIWNGITAIFSVVASWFRQQFQSAWSAIQSIWSVAVGFFRGIWNGITAIFSVVSSWFRQQFQSAWNAIKNIWNSATGFFRGIWNGITGIFSSAGSWFGNVFNSAANSVRNAWNSITGFFRGIWSGIQSVFGSVSSWFGNVFGSAVNAIKAPINWIIDGVNKMIGGLNSLKFTAPDWVPGIGGKSIGFNLPRLPRLAQGGVLKRGQVGLLEGSGAEAVVPLEKNKEWLQKVAVELADSLRGTANSSSAGSDFNSGNTINFYQTNNSPKPLNRLEIYRQTKNALRYASR